MSLEDNNKSNSFFSVFNSGGGGGGGGNVTSASNVGTGVGVFKQKVLQDLEFRTLLAGKGINIALTSPSFDEVEIGLDTDVVGIADGTGWYTFYPSVTDALNVAVAGDTITFFSDINETTSISLNLINGVDFDLNGFSYTLSVADGTNMFNTPAGNVKVRFFNGGLFRTNAIQTTSNDGLVFRFTQTTELIFDDNFIISNDTACVIRTGKLATIFGGIWQGGNATFLYSIDSEGIWNNSIFYVEEAVLNNEQMNNCIIWNKSGISGSYACSGAGEYNNCFVRGMNGINITSTGRANGCEVYAEEDTAINSNRGIINNCSLRGGANTLIAISNSVGNYTRVSNTSVYSNSYPAIFTRRAIISNCRAFTTTGSLAGNTCEDEGSSIYSNNHVENDWNNALAIGIITDASVGISTFSNNTINVRNASGYCFAGNTNTAYLVANVGVGASLLIDTLTLTNAMTNTTDLYGNILIG